MSVRERQYVIWGVKIEYPDYDTYDGLGLATEYHAAENVGKIKVVEQMDGDPCYLGFVWDGADTYDGEGLSREGPLPEYEHMYEKHWPQIMAALGKLNIEPVVGPPGWHVFTQYS